MTSKLIKAIADDLYIDLFRHAFNLNSMFEATGYIALFTDLDTNDKAYAEQNKKEILLAVCEKLSEEINGFSSIWSESPFFTAKLEDYKQALESLKEEANS